MQLVPLLFTVPTLDTDDESSIHLFQTHYFNVTHVNGIEFSLNTHHLALDPHTIRMLKVKNFSISLNTSNN